MFSVTEAICIGVFGALFKNCLISEAKTPLLLNSFKISKTVKDDVFNGKPSSYYWCKVVTDSNQVIGHFDYRASVGQIGSIYVHPNHKGRLLKEQMLIYMMKDMQDAGATDIWEVCPKMNKKMPKILYHGLWNFTYKPSKCVHYSVTGGGYTMPIPKDLRTLQIR